MKQRLKIVGILLAIAMLPAIGTVRWTTRQNVPFCAASPGCNFSYEPKGWLTERQHGFPLSYRVITTFVPAHNDPDDPKYAGYTSATSQRQGFSLPYALLNILFWLALIKLAYDLWPKRRTGSSQTASSGTTKTAEEPKLVHKNYDKA